MYIIALIGLLHIVRILLDHKSCVADAVFLRQIIYIIPPYLCIKFRDRHPVIPLNIFALPSGNRRWEIINIKRRTVDHRPCACFFQQAVSCGVEPPVCLFHNSDIAEYSLSFSLLCLPDQRNQIFICRFHIDLCVIIQGY